MPINRRLRNTGFRLALVVSVSLPLDLHAELKLPGVIGDHMVLQRKQANPIWGWDTPHTGITVSFAGHNYSTTTDAEGRWSVKLAPLPANSHPQTMTVTGSSTREIHDVLVGEVWLCSGQSNMEMGIRAVQDGTNEIAAANFPSLRLLMVPNVWKPEPQADQTGAWNVCTATNISQGSPDGFSAVGYFFGRELHRKLNVPVGLIDATWGGTRIESWTPPAGFAAVSALSALHAALQLHDPQNAVQQKRLAEFLVQTEQWLSAARAAQSNRTLVPTMPAYPPELLPPHDLEDPTALFNGMIHPLHPFGIRGAIWYQGEANNGEGMIYAEKMKALVGGWRHVWEQGDLPFYFVQIAPFNYDGGAEELCELWEAQTTAAREIPNVGMAVINDIGDLKDIHPKDKQEVARRLALLALAKTYGQKDLVCSGPTFQSMFTEGSALRIRFDNTGGGLASRDGKDLNWFEIRDAGKDRFVKAEARIDGPSVVLSAPEVRHPVAVRFAWSQLAVPNLMNAAGLPAGAFRAESGKKPD